MKYSFDEEGVAFYYFVLTLVGLYVVPTTIRMLWPKRVAEHDREPECTCQGCERKKRHLKSIHAANQKWRLPKLVMLVALWSVFFWALRAALLVKSNFKLYDPFEILGVPTSANNEEISKAFKKLSRRWHPDKAAEEDRSKAEHMFVEIGKAYKSLTDERIRKNWEEYGNPDGIRSFALGVALPAWLVSSGNGLFMLALYCLAFGIGLPLLVKTWWSRSKSLTKDGLMHESMALFYREMKESASPKKLMEVLAQASEFQGLDISISTDEWDFEPLKKSVQPSAAQVYAALWAHTHGIELNGVSEEKLALIVGKAVLLVQGLWDDNLPVQMLPNLNKDIAKHCLARKIPVKTIDDLLELKEEDRRSLLRNVSEKDYQNLMQLAVHFPSVRVERVTCKVLDQKVITPGSIVTCQASLALEYPATPGAQPDATQSPTLSEKLDEEVQTFEFDEDGNLIEDPISKSKLNGGQACKPIHCPSYPKAKRPIWWVFLTNRHNTNIVAGPIKVTDLIDTKTVTLQFPSPPRPMPVALSLHIKSDCLLGVDIEREIRMTVVAASQLSPDLEDKEWDISGDEADQTVPFSINEDE